MEAMKAQGQAQGQVLDLQAEPKHKSIHYQCYTTVVRNQEGILPRGITGFGDLESHIGRLKLFGISIVWQM